MKQRYAELVDKQLEVTLRSGDEYMCRCPKHDDRSASLQVNVVKGLFICFSCGWKGSIRTLLGNIKEPEPEIADVLAILDAVDNATHAPERPTTLPEATLRRFGFPTTYWHDRGLTDATVALFQLGYDPMNNEAIIPVRNMNGGLIGVIRRLLEMDAHPKYLYYKGFPRKTSLFASWLVAKHATDHVVITEGAVDSMSVWDAGIPAVAQYGSSISREQVVLLRRMGIAKVTLFYDNDKAGREATLTAIPLLRDFLVYAVSYPDSAGKIDPGGMPADQIRGYVDRATLIL